MASLVQAACLKLALVPRPATSLLNGCSSRQLSLWSWISSRLTHYEPIASSVQSVWPQARQQPHSWVGLDQHTIQDEYRWMERDEQGLAAHLTAEAAFCEARLHETATTALASTLHAELLAQQQDHERVAAPGERLGPWLYNSGTGDQLLIRSPLTPDAHQPHVVLDGSKLQSLVEAAQASTGLTLVPAIIEMKLSKDHKLLAVVVPMEQPGWTSDVGAALLLDCDTCQLLAGGVIPSVGSVEWLPSGAALLATHLDSTGRAYQVSLHTLPRPGVPAASHQLLTTTSCSSSNSTTTGLGSGPPDSSIYLSVGRTKDWQYMMVSAHTKTSSEVYLLDSSWDGSRPPVLTCVKQRQPGMEYMVESDGHHNLLILTNRVCTPASSRMESQGHSSPRDTDQLMPERPTHQHDYMLAVIHNWRNRAVQGDGASKVHNAAWQQLTGLYLSLSYEAVQGDAVSGQASGWCDQGIYVLDMDVFDGWCALYGTAWGRPAVWVVHLSRGATAATRDPSVCCHDTGCRVSSTVRTPLPTWATAVIPGLNADFSAHTLRLICSSPAHPPHTFDYNVLDNSLQLLHVEHVVGRFQGSTAWEQPLTASPSRAPREHSAVYTSQASAALHNPDEYVVEQVWVDAQAGRCVRNSSPSDDGTCTPSAAGYVPSSRHHYVPVTLAYHKSLALGSLHRRGSSSPRVMPGQGPHDNGPPTPVVLFGYGAYGQVLDTAWNPHHLLLLQRGVVLAFAHVRGGGELGRSWHAAGRGVHKRVSLTDFNQVARALVASGIAAPGMLAVHTYSAGALLAGGIVSEPTTRALISSVVIRLGFLDLVSVMHQPNLPLSLHEQEEWGQPEDAQQAAVMRLVCPYSQLQALEQQLIGAGNAVAQQQGPLPPILCSTATRDARVPTWMPAKWIARARRVQDHLGDGEPSPLLRVLWDRGHYADAQEALQDWAMEAAFMLRGWQAQHG